MDEESVVAAVPEAFYPPSQKQMSIGREESISAAVGSTVSPPDAATHWLESAAAGMFILPAQRPPLPHRYCHRLQPTLSSSLSLPPATALHHYTYLPVTDSLCLAAIFFLSFVPILSLELLSGVVQNERKKEGACLSLSFHPMRCCNGCTESLIPIMCLQCATHRKAARHVPNTYRFFAIYSFIVV